MGGSRPPHARWQSAGLHQGHADRSATHQAMLDLPHRDMCGTCRGSQTPAQMPRCFCPCSNAWGQGLVHPMTLVGQPGMLVEASAASCCHAVDMVPCPLRPAFMAAMQTCSSLAQLGSQAQAALWGSAPNPASAHVDPTAWGVLGGQGPSAQPRPCMIAHVALT